MISTSPGYFALYLHIEKYLLLDYGFHNLVRTCHCHLRLCKRRWDGLVSDEQVDEFSIVLQLLPATAGFVWFLEFSAHVPVIRVITIAGQTAEDAFLLGNPDSHLILQNFLHVLHHADHKLREVFLFCIPTPLLHHLLKIIFYLSWIHFRVRKAHSILYTSSFAIIIILIID